MPNRRTAIISESSDVNYFGLAAKSLVIYAFGAGVILLADASRDVPGRTLDAVFRPANAASGAAPQAQGKTATAPAESPAVAYFPDGYTLNATEIEAPIAQF